MKLHVLCLASLAALAPPASAQADTDYPHLDWGKVATLDMTVTEATACIVRELSGRGKAVAIPLDGGADIDFHPNAGFVTSTRPWETFKLSAGQGATLLRILYRRPYKLRMVEKDVARLQARCLKVANVAPTSAR